MTFPPGMTPYVRIDVELHIKLPDGDGVCNTSYAIALLFCPAFIDLLNAGFRK